MSVLVWGVDDVRPEDVCEKPLKLLEDFKKTHTNVKITLFVTPDWIYKPQNKFVQKDKLGILKKIIGVNHWPKGTFDIDKYKSWVKSLKGFEVADHGLTHFHNGRPFAAEFHQLNYNECKNKVENIIEIFGNVQTKPKGFAPPGWGTNENLIKCLSEFGFEYVAGCVDDNVKVNKNAIANQAGLKNVSAFFTTKLDTIVNIPRNWDIHKSNIQRAEEIIKINGIIGLHSHILNGYLGEKIGNGITEENLRNVSNLLDFIEKNYPGTEFKTFAELSKDFYSNLAKIKPTNLA